MTLANLVVKRRAINIALLNSARKAAAVVGSEEVGMLVISSKGPESERLKTVGPGGASVVVHVDLGQCQRLLVSKGRYTNILGTALAVGSTVSVHYECGAGGCHEGEEGDWELHLGCRW